MSRAWNYCCCCYSAGTLEKLSRPALDIYASIYKPQGLVIYDSQLIACLRCHQFLEEVNRFKNERQEVGKICNNLNVKLHKNELLSIEVIKGNSSQINNKTEVSDEYQIDIQINEVEVDSDAEKFQEISKKSLEIHIVPNVANRNDCLNNSVNSNEENLLSDLYHSGKHLPGRIGHNSGQIAKQQDDHDHDGDKPFKCSECSYTTAYMLHLKRHFLTHSDMKPFKCNQCDYRCKRKDTLTLHLRYHLKKVDNPYQCSECSYSAVSMPHLKRHALAHSTEKPYSCNQCEYRCKRKDHLTLHMRNHLKNVDKPYQCSECSFTTTTMTHLKTHIAYKHSDEKPFECDQCGNCFKTKDKIIAHIRKHLEEVIGSERPKPHECTECSYTTDSFANLRRHTLCHFNEKPLSCDHCEYRSHRKDAIRIHMKRVHMSEAELPYKCNECPFKTATLTRFKYHVASKHDGDRPFPCDRCDKRFIEKFQLTNHQKIHLKEHAEQLKCDKCAYTTTKSVNLMNHVASKHNVETLFSCDQCNYRSKNKVNLNVHKKIHLKDCDKPYKCSECSFTTTTGKYLKRHMCRHT